MSEEKEGLMEKALSTYKASQEEQKRMREAFVQVFAEKAIKEFKSDFKKEPEKVIPVSGNECLLICDGLEFRAKGQGVGVTYYLKLKCEKCGRTFEQNVGSLISLGAVLSEPQICLECKWKGE